MSKSSDQDKFEPGEVIFSKGDASECAFLIQSGSVEIVIENGDRRVVVDTLEPGEFFGEMALVDDEPRSATAIAKDPTTCVMVVKQEFGERLENSDPLTRAMLKLLVKRLRKTTQGRNAIS